MSVEAMVNLEHRTLPRKRIRSRRNLMVCSCFTERLLNLCLLLLRMEIHSCLGSAWRAAVRLQIVSDYLAHCLARGFG